MAVWKELNPETGEYEEIPGASVPSCGTGGDDSSEDAAVVFPDLEGKTIIFMGDSYTYAMRAILKSMAAEFNALDNNQGKVGSTICGNDPNVGGKGTLPMWWRTKQLCDEYVASGAAANVGAIVFMGGANDLSDVAEWIGSGLQDTDTGHVYGAMHYLLNYFHETFPDAPIFVILQPSHYGVSHDNITTDEEAKVKGFDNLAQMQAMNTIQFSHFTHCARQYAVRAVAEFYNCHIVDCCFDWHSVFSSTDRARYWSEDTLHLTGDGYQDVMRKLKSKMIEVLAQ